MRDVRIKAISRDIYAVNKEIKLDNDAARLDRYAALEKRIRDCFEKGELDKSEYGFLMGVLENQQKALRS